MNDGRLRVALLRSDDAHHVYLETLLRSRFQLVLVVVEPARWQMRRLFERRRYRDWAWRRYHAWRRRLLGLNAYRARYFGGERLGAAAGEDRGVIVRSINDSVVVEALTEARPDVTVVIGTGILGERVLDAAGEAVLNVHGGYLPYYRGNHCFFFALYEEAWDRIGSSIHFVDRGVDTGDLVEVVVPEIRPDDSAERLYCRAERAAIHRLVELLAELEAGAALPRSPQPAGGRTYRTRDRKPHHDLLLWVRRRFGFVRVPARAPAIAERASLRPRGDRESAPVREESTGQAASGIPDSGR